MFKARLVYLRKSKDLNQSQLGEILHLSQRSISRLERGDTLPDQTVLNQIADFFNVSVDYLLGRTDIPNIYDLLPRIYSFLEKNSKTD